MKRDELGGQIPCIGIDANNLLTSLLVSLFNTTHMNGNGAIGNLLSTLCRYTCGQAILIFVFDGPQTSDYKVSNVLNGTIPFHEEAKILIRAFGGYILEAAEADAQLSWMSDKGILDAVISEDSDMVVRGVCSVLCFNLEQTTKDNHQEIYFDEYTFTALKHSQLKLTKGGLLLVALLVGSDYADRIDGCGIVTAIQLATCSLGDTLRNGYLSMCSDPANSEPAVLQLQLRKFCLHWHGRLCKELTTNLSGKLTVTIHLYSRQQAPIQTPLPTQLTSPLPPFPLIQNISIDDSAEYVEPCIQTTTPDHAQQTSPHATPSHNI
ncbi:hypothetical protein PM082_011889 [Marasmius tenuissimus]|nr:hypothetical protein PM082_011889 [Marasmius tenuissimus]